MCLFSIWIVWSSKITARTETHAIYNSVLYRRMGEWYSMKGRCSYACVHFACLVYVPRPNNSVVEVFVLETKGLTHFKTSLVFSYDLSNTFDHISHSLLLHKISAFRISGGYVNRFHNYISNRKSPCFWYFFLTF